MKKKILMLIILGVVVLALIGGGIWFFVGEDKIAFEVTGYYDSQGNLITDRTQAVVGGVEGVKYLKFTINAHNTDTVPLDLVITGGNPSTLASALPTETKTAQPGEYSTWTSGLVDIEDYVGTTQTFSVTVKADSEARQPLEKSFSLDIQIDEDPQAIFDIEVTGGAENDPNFDPGGDDEEPTQTGDVIFRTSSLSYGSGAGVAYASSCGDTLTAYGKTTGACTSFLCSDTNPDLEVPSSSGALKMWVDGSTNLCICDVGQTSGYSKRYSTSDSDASNVNTSPTSIDSSMEVAC